MSSRPVDESPVPKALADAWRQSGPSDAQVTRAYLRFLGRRARRRLPARSAVLWFAAGMLLGVGTLYAGTSLRLIGSSPQPTAPTPAPRAPATSAARAGAPRTTATPNATAAPAPSAAVYEARPRSEPKSAAAESWQRVARGLRESDLETADDALLKLSRQGSASEREVATLVRAQVLIRQGRDAEARGLLVELGRSATSAATRSKAATLLNQLPPEAPSHRSFDPEPGTNTP